MFKRGHPRPCLCRACADEWTPVPPARPAPPGTKERPAGPEVQEGSSRPAAESTFGSPAVGAVKALLDAKGSQERAIRLIDEAEAYAYVTAFTYDRQDLTDALIRARRRGLTVSVAVDKKNTLSGSTRDQLKRLKELEAHGAQVRVCNGSGYAEEYRAVGRAAVGGLGLQHSKTILTDQAALIGSTNWTTASRANVEVGVHVVLEAEARGELRARLDGVLAAGTPLKDAEVLAEQRTRSGSPVRRRSVPAQR